MGQETTEVRVVVGRASAWTSRSLSSTVTVVVRASRFSHWMPRARAATEGMEEALG
jgi:hypothetical protein